MNPQRNALTWTAAAALLAFGGAAHALSVVASPAGTGSNLVSNACNFSTIDSGTTVTGCLSSDANQLVTISSDEALVFDAGGQARIEGADGAYSQLSINVDGQSLGLLVLNLNTSADGFVSFTDGTDTSALFALDQNGQNFFTITGLFDTLSYTTFSDQVGTESDIVADTRQIRFGIGDTPSPVPEPGTYALMLAGLGVIGFMVRRRRSNIS